MQRCKPRRQVVLVKNTRKPLNDTSFDMAPSVAEADAILASFAPDVEAAELAVA